MEKVMNGNVGGYALSSKAFRDTTLEPGKYNRKNLHFGGSRRIRPMLEGNGLKGCIQDKKKFLSPIVTSSQQDQDWILSCQFEVMLHTLIILHSNLLDVTIPTLNTQRDGTKAFKWWKPYHPSYGVTSTPHTRIHKDASN
ncbi:hypothetical protein Tco_1041057 [Tanacetum coccineum]|uniref:Uncharacterized protein n=1 Tax=Tanacetum coccineum TaxID=301880 RepID=A0ABQ5GHJ7_9ASTR